MSDTFRSLLRSRATWVVGKGGVGKTTTACAVAIQSAESGVQTHLISTDPAHSIDDVLNGESCSPRLEVDEFDAPAYAERWLERRRDALVEVVEQGTYLDAADARAFLELSFPGVDEVMAALRLVELAAGNAERIVIDTAPTGHTLRLLDAPGVLDSWASALEAMIAKADAVALALVGGAPQRPARALVDELRATSQSFTKLLADSDIVIVTRADPVVTAETTRLRDALTARAHRNLVVLSTGPNPDADWFVEKAVPPRGCEELRRWEPSHLPPSTFHPPPNSAGRDRVEGGGWKVDGGRDFVGGLPPLLLVAGKGGVGKSTCSAALALLRAESLGTCLISTGPAGSLGDVFGHESGAKPSAISPQLRVWQLDADAEYARIRSGYEEEVRRVFEELGLDQSVALDRRVIERLWSLAPPGLDEIIALSELLAAAEACDSVVLDSAPTGHFLRLVAMPQIGVDWAHALLRTLLKYRVAGAIERFSREVLDFAQRTRKLQERLTAPNEAAAVIVTLDEPVVWAETRRLHAALQAAKIRVAALIINRADAGPARSPSEYADLRDLAIVHAPQMDPPPSGNAELHDFIMRWEVDSSE